MLDNRHTVGSRARIDDSHLQDTESTRPQETGGASGAASRTTTPKSAPTSDRSQSNRTAGSRHPANNGRTKTSMRARSPVHSGIPKPGQTGDRPLPQPIKADNDTMIDGLKHMFSASGADVWAKSGDFIRGSIEYDQGNDQRPLDALTANIRAAERKLDDAKREMTASADPFSGTPWPADYAAYETAKQNVVDAKQAYEDGKKAWGEASQKHLANARPYAGGAVTLDSSNRLADGTNADGANWVVSATDARELFSKAAQNAKEKIDQRLGNAWEQLVLDLREWRAKNIGQIGAGSIDRQMNKTAETYLLLEQDAALKKGIIDARVKNFNDLLDKNQSAALAESNVDNEAKKSRLIDLLRERRASLESAVADVNDQGNLAASLMAATVNNSRLATPKTNETPFVSESTYKGNADDYAGKLSFYDTSSGKDVLIGTKDLGVAPIAMRKENGVAVLPDHIAPPPLTPPGTHLKLAYSYERQGAASYPTQNGIAFATQQTSGQKQAEKDFVKYGGPVAGFVRAGEYGYVRFNNSQFVKDKLPALSRYQTPMMPFHQPVPATVQFATRGVSIASDFTRGAMYLESAAGKVARGEDPTSDYVAAGAAFAQGTVDSSIGLYVDAALVSASQYKADNPQVKLSGKPVKPPTPEGSGKPVRGISYEYRPDGTVENAQRLDPETGELQSYTPARDEFAMRDLAGDPSPSTSGATSGPAPGEPVVRTAAAMADAEIRSGIEESANSMVQSAERVAQAYQPLNTHGMPQINNSRARLAAITAELRENAGRLKSSFQKFAFDVELNRANELGGTKWSIPGGVKLMAYASAGLIVPALVEYGVKVSDYIAKANQGKLTPADDLGLAASTTSTVAMVTPYIPVVGPVITPFLLIASMALNAAAGSANKTPVERVSAQLLSQTAHPLANLGGYYPIVRPAPQV
jgi:hypothetical protein